MNNLTLDFEQARSKHLLFKSRLRSILYDIDIDEAPVLSHFECSVGQWIYKHALQVYGHLPEMIELEKVHKDIHTAAKKLVELHKGGKTQEARNGLSEMEAIADHLVALLSTIEGKIEISLPIPSSNLNIELTEYHDLLKSNAELDKRIKQQILENNRATLKYETVLAALHEGIIIQDANGVLQTANKSAEHLLGMSISQLMGLTSMDPLWGAIDENGRSLSGDEHPPMVALKTRLPQIDQIMGLKHSNGSLVWVQVNSQPLIDKVTGELTGVVSSFFNVTSTKKLITDLQESEMRFRTMMEALPQIAWTVTIDGKASFFNPQWYNYTGLSFEQTNDWGWQSVIHPDDLPEALSLWTELHKDHSGSEIEIRYQRADGVYLWHLVRIKPIKNEHNELQYWIGTSTDINEIKQLQQQKDDFISIASHELKTPITSLKASLQLLYKMKDNPSAKTLPFLVEQANKSTERVNALIEDLLNVSKFNQGQLHLNKRQFTVAEMINECCHDIRMGALYEIVTTGDKALQIYADPERMRQIIVNFVNNAIKYAPASREIKIHIEKLKDGAKVSVTDKGTGIDAEKLPHLFERYYRVDSSGIQYSGLGLGLYICAEIIKKHDGQIGVDSELGKGSTFWFTLPV